MHLDLDAAISDEQRQQQTAEPWGSKAEAALCRSLAAHNS